MCVQICFPVISAAGMFSSQIRNQTYESDVKDIFRGTTVLVLN